MTVPVFDAAKRLCEKSGWTLSNLELQKLLYIGHMFHLGHRGKPLILGQFEAWDYGPVQPELYHRVKVFGSSHVGDVFRSARDLEDGTESRLLDEVIDKLSHKTSGWLVASTHWVEGAWAKHYVPGARGIIIPDEDILQEYQDRARAIAAAKQQT